MSQFSDREMNGGFGLTVTVYFESVLRAAQKNVEVQPSGTATAREPR